MSLHAFGSGSIGYSTIRRNNIKNYQSQIISNTTVISPNSHVISDTHIIGTSKAGIAGIVSLSIKNTITIDRLNGAKPNEPSWALLPIPPTFKQTINLGKFRK
jgi:hypothetical protein